MGVYLVSVDADDWADDELLVAVRSDLDRALVAQGLARYDGPPPVPAVPAGEGDHFEEKLSRDRRGFVRLCTERFGGTAPAGISYWSMIIPVAFEEPIELAAPSAYDDTTTVGSAVTMRAAMAELAQALDLPMQVPRRSDNLDITSWFDQVEAGNVSAPGGSWRNDLDAAFYVAMFLRAAQFSVQRSCPMRYV